MRKLIILRGAPGVGKSTFIRNQALENYTLSLDEMRLMFASPQMTKDYKEEIPQFNNQKVWNLLYSILEERMKKGEFTIIDATHINYDECFTTYKKLAEKYRYRLYILDFTGIPKEEVYTRNASREAYKVVPTYAIDKAYETLPKSKIPSAFKIVEPENFADIINDSPKNCDKYEHVHIIGDIHGCYTALKDYFASHPLNPRDAYIFVGDYFDRGIENYETFQYLTTIMSADNVTLLLGNHEDKLYKYACGDDYKMDYGLKKTIEEFTSRGIDKSMIRGFIKQLAQISYITFGASSYLITHGGIAYMPNKHLDFYSTNSFIYGIDNYDVNIDALYDEYMAKEKNKIYQIHGHRNHQKVSCDEYEYSINLDGDIECGGHLRVIILNKDGSHECIEIKNDVYNPRLKEETNVYNLVVDLQKNKHVFVRDLGDDIYSFNFSKEAFYNRIWNDMTTQARGLFIDVKNDVIVARSYNKFFKVNERKETELNTLATNLSYPVNFYLKYNGFLGILSVLKGELFFASKSTNTGAYVEYFKNIFYNEYNEKQIDALRELMMKRHASIVFEVIDPVNDAHIIEYRRQTIVILDVIYNTTAFSKIPYEELYEFAQKYSLEVKKRAYIAHDEEEFVSLYNMVTSEDYRLDGEYVEGFVIEDENNFMVKVKTTYYDTWKYLRARMEYALQNKVYDCKSKDKLEKKFMSYLQEKYESAERDSQKINIVLERAEFLKKEKNL